MFNVAFLFFNSESFGECPQAGQILCKFFFQNVLLLLKLGFGTLRSIISKYGTTLLLLVLLFHLIQQGVNIVKLDLMLFFRARAAKSLRWSV